jgi:peptidoglycan hydrolase-like protein with peptidoglycan-binding domain
VSRKAVRKGARSRAAQSGDGMMAGIVDRVFENPAMSGGLMVMALTATAIISNAMFLQRGHHPDPLFMTRPSVAREAPRPATVRPVRQPPQAVIVVPPLPRLAPIDHKLPPEPVVVPPPVLEVQRELARLGLYSGAIDGVAGSRTAAAISAYETAAGLPVTGLATPELLEAMKQPLPPKPQAMLSTPDITAAELDRREQERAAKIAAEQQTHAEAQMQNNFRVIQGALNRIGYGPVPVDGTEGDETIDAIRRFELDNGLPVSGEASEDLLARLIAIGAIKAT